MLRKISFERGTRERVSGIGGERDWGRKGHTRGEWSPAVTLSRLCGPPAGSSTRRATPFLHDTFAYPLLVLKCNRGAERIMTIESFYDTAELWYYDSAMLELERN